MTRLGPVAAAIAHVYDVPVRRLIGSDLNHRVVEPRELLAWFGRHRLRMSLEAIGRELGRHHTTVMYRLDRVDARLKAGDTGLRERVAAVRERLALGAG